MRCLLLMIIFNSLLACRSLTAPSSASEISGEQPPNRDEESSFVLPGMEENLLVTEIKDFSSVQKPRSVALVRLSEDVEITKLAIGLLGNRQLAKSEFGFFYLFDDQKLYVIEGSSGLIVKTLDCPLIKDFIILDANTILAAKFDSLELVRISLAKTNAIEPILSIKDISHSSQIETISKFADRIYLTTGDPKGVSELWELNSDGTKTERSLTLPKLNSPHFTPALHRSSQTLYIPGSPKRPISIGFTAAVNLKDFTLNEHLAFSPATFNGSLAISNQLGTAIHLEHTSTPVSSTHAALRTLGTQGELIDFKEKATIFDLFEERNDFDLNQKETLYVLPNACLVGFCTVGKGLNFVDMKSGAYLPKLFASKLGFTPHLVRFLKNNEKP